MSLVKVTDSCVIDFRDHGNYYSGTAKGGDVIGDMAAIIATSLNDLIEKLKGVMIEPVPDMVWESIRDQLTKDGYR
ncbi:TPA: hypothetical protein SLN68_000079 [Serratia marcescens]|uniref:hypothetical protein n=1 Tax=Serratia TaxID=613 RepID=UPI00257D9AFF|nr:hypothetical protein [Serratia nevei]MDM3548116.1 hypothetical protein [Serratia nevei]HEI9813758.1 hypothetical protein [Serratia marcescens]